MKPATPINLATTAAEQIEDLHETLRECRHDIVDAFLLGASEFRESITTRLDTEEERNAYDAGREWAHKATSRYWED